MEKFPITRSMFDKRRFSHLHQERIFQYVNISSNAAHEDNAHASIQNMNNQRYETICWFIIQKPSCAPSGLPLHDDTVCTAVLEQIDGLLLFWFNVPCSEWNPKNWAGTVPEISTSSTSRYRFVPYCYYGERKKKTFTDRYLLDIAKRWYDVIAIRESPRCCQRSESATEIIYVIHKFCGTASDFHVRCDVLVRVNLKNWDFHKAWRTSYAVNRNTVWKKALSVFFQFRFKTIQFNFWKLDISWALW